MRASTGVRRDDDGGRGWCRGSPARRRGRRSATAGRRRRSRGSVRRGETGRRRRRRVAAAECSRLSRAVVIDIRRAPGAAPGLRSAARGWGCASAACAPPRRRPRRGARRGASRVGIAGAPQRRRRRRGRGREGRRAGPLCPASLLPSPLLMARTEPYRPASRSASTRASSRRSSSCQVARSGQRAPGAAVGRARRASPPRRRRCRRAASTLRTCSSVSGRQSDALAARAHGRAAARRGPP